MLGASEDRYYRRLCDSLGFVCIGVDRDLQITFWNDRATEQFGQPREKMLGRPFLEVLHEGDRESVERRFVQAMDARSHAETEVKYPLTRGDRTTLVLIISPILDDAGECVGASACMRDISKRKRLAQEAANSRRMAALGRMSGAVAHHFNNILGGMLTSVDYVLTSDSPRELRRTLRLLAQAIGRATRITNQLAAFAESENHVVEWADLNPIIEAFLEHLQRRARRAKIEVETNIAKVSSEPFEAQRLMPVLESVAQNSLDSMAPGGIISITMFEDAGAAIIKIADTGCGIPEDMLDRVFEPFFTTKGELGGGDGDNIGLGLAAVHGLLAEMGGSLHLTSEVGEGTEVSIRLPLRRKQPREGVKPEPTK